MRKPPLFKRLRFRFLAVFVLFLLCGCLITGWFSINTAQKAMDAAMEKQFISTMGIAENFIGLVEQANESLARHVISEKELIEVASKHDHKGIERFIKTHITGPDVDMVLFIDRMGNIIADSNRGRQVGTSLKHLAMVKNAKERNLISSSLVDSGGNFVSITAAAVMNRNEPADLAGVILIGSIIGNSFLEKIKSNTELDLSLIRDLRVLASTLRVSDERISQLPIPFTQYQSLLDNQGQIMPIKLSGKRYFISARRLMGIEHHTSASMLLAHSQQDYLDIIDGIYQQFFSIFLLGFILAVALAVWLSSRFLHFIDILRDGAERLASGHLESRIKVESGDELQMLAENFNSMAEAIHKNNQVMSRYSDNLEQKVEDRTLELRKEERAHADSEERVKAIIENVIDGLLTTNEQGIIESFNPAAERMFGYSADEVIGQNVSMLIPSPHREKHDEYISNYLQAGKGPIVGVMLEVVGQRKDGSQFHHNLSLSEMLIQEESEADGEISTRRIFIATTQDLTERKQAEKALRRAQKMDAVGQLTGGIAHDFNNILSIIIGNLSFLSRQVTDDEKALKRVSSAEKAALRAADLTKQLLGFSRKQAQKALPTNINQLVHNMDSLISRSITPEVEVEHHLADDLWLTEIDSGDFDDALLNLVLNARDAMPNGGKLTIETSNKVLDATYTEINPTVVPGDYVELAVSDTGSGISRDDMEHIFEPFFTTKPHGKGTGLGMSMVFGFTQRSQGYVKVYSELGIGTTMRCYLPRSQSATNRDDTPVAKEDLLPRGSETILVVDDEEGLLELAQQYLEELGYTTLAAASGQQALELLAQRTAIDLLFSDVVMPGGINGYELAEQAETIQPKIKVLLTSGYTNKSLLNNMQARFKTNLLTKPYNQSEIANRVRIILDE
ncbi:MAG: PAS domain S-box protein [Gammaproteobacteria bacterium]|nr:PAS domain S-box protein [Gammaproteobacteria bacterium]